MPKKLGPDDVFSGSGTCQDNPSDECQSSYGKGPIPEGLYDLVPYDGNHADSENWWRARPQSIVQRFLDSRDMGRGGGYLLHPGRVSRGCITRKKGFKDAVPKDYKELDELLIRDQPNTLRVVK